jgi:transposase-like protein
MKIEVPRDRSGSFEPLLIAKGQKRFEGFDEKIIAMYARGMTVREIAGFLLDHYKVEVSADFISTVTDSVLEAVVEWQNRPLERSYPVVYFDALRVKIRDEGSVRNKAVYLALGIAADGTKDVLGIWIEQNEGAKFWLKVMNELRNRGVEDILIGVVDGLQGLSGGHHHGLPLGERADLYRALEPLLPLLLRLEGAPGVGSRTEGHLPGRNRGGRRQASHGVRSRPLGQKVSDDR